MKKKNKNKIEAPAVVHGQSDHEQGIWFRDTLDKTRRHFVGENGKGSTPRTDTNSSQWQQNYDEINWKK